MFAHGVHGPPAETSTEPRRLRGDEWPSILIDTNEHRVICETITALAADPDIYQRGGILVRVLRPTSPRDSIIRARGSATTYPLPPANLRERIERKPR